MVINKISQDDVSNSIVISFIIPCYNSQKTIARCLESIATNQTAYIEIICVDDYSTDNTAGIINSFVEQDDRIKYFKKSKHSNAGDTRNIGINKASGLYCWFVDSDDTVASDGINKLIKNIKQHSYPDSIIFNYKVITEQGYREKKCIHSASNTTIKIEDINLNFYYKQTGVIVWNKLFKTKIINDNKLDFQSITSSNDVFFSRAYVSIVKSVLFLDEYIYIHDKTIKESISASRGHNLLNTHLANLKLRKYLIQNNKYKKFKKTFLESYQSNVRHESKNTNRVAYKLFHISILLLLKILSRC